MSFSENDDGGCMDEFSPVDDPQCSSPSVRGDFKASKGECTFGSSKQYVFSGDEPLTYLKWCAWLVPMVLRSRTSFSAFVAKSISLSRGHRSGGPSPTFYPIPVPYMDIFVGMPSLSSTKRHTRLLRRAVHVGAFPEDVLLRREPSKQHRFLFAKFVPMSGRTAWLLGFLSGSRVEEFQNYLHAFQDSVRC